MHIYLLVVDEADLSTEQRAWLENGSVHKHQAFAFHSFLKFWHNHDGLIQTARLRRSDEKLSELIFGLGCTATSLSSSTSTITGVNRSEHKIGRPKILCKYNKYAMIFLRLPTRHIHRSYTRVNQCAQWEFLNVFDRVKVNLSMELGKRP